MYVSIYLSLYLSIYLSICQRFFEVEFDGDITLHEILLNKLQSLVFIVQKCVLIGGIFGIQH